MAIQAEKNDSTDPTEELERELEVAKEVGPDRINPPPRQTTRGIHLSEASARSSCFLKHAVCVTQGERRSSDMFFVGSAGSFPAVLSTDGVGEMRTVVEEPATITQDMAI